MIIENRISDASKVVPFGRSSQFYFSRAMREYERGNLRRVCELLLSAIKYNPDDIWNYYNLALTYEELGDYDAAISVWNNEVLERDNNFSEAYFHLAVCYAETEDMNLVYKYMEKYLELEPNGDLESAARHILELLKESRNAINLGDESDTSYQTMIELEKKLASIINVQAYDEAVRICEDSILANGESLPLLNRTALMCFLAGEDQKGLHYIKKVFASDQNNIGAYCNLLFYYNSLNDDLKVQAIIEKVNDIQFASLSEVLKWSCMLGSIGKHRRTYEMLRDIYWSGEYNTEMLYQLGVAALNMEKYKEAKDYWRQAALLDEIRSPAELYHQLLLQTDDAASLLLFCDYNYDWPLINIIQSNRDGEYLEFSETEKQIIYICIQYYLRYGTVDTVNMVLNCMSVLDKQLQLSLLKEFMLSSYDEMKYHILKNYNPNVQGITAIRNKDLIYHLEDSLKVKVTVPFLVAGRMIKENLEAYKSPVLVNVGQKVWSSYCNRSHPKPRRISKSTVWAAATECLVLKLFNFECDINSVIRRYNIKEASLKRALSCLEEIITTSYLE